jgi:hypothetical protein
MPLRFTFDRFKNKNYKDQTFRSAKSASFNLHIIMKSDMIIGLLHAPIQACIIDASRECCLIPAHENKRSI